MDPVLLIALVLGALAGAIAAALLQRGRLRQREAVLGERLANREAALAELRQEAAAAASELAAVRAELQAESRLRSAAEERTSRIPSLEESLRRKEDLLAGLQRDNADLQAEVSRLGTRLEDERRSLEQQLATVTDARRQLSDTFQALSADALRQSSQSFLELARQTLDLSRSEASSDLEARQKAIENLVQPLRESLQRVDQQIQELENSRQAAYGGIQSQVRSLVESQDRLQTETHRLVQALRSPNVRGRWGEIQLRRVVEIAGMLSHCDFLEQASVDGEEGKLRPDLVVMLPGGKTVVVDAKAPLKAYLDALECDDEASRRHHLTIHSRQLRDHMARLSGKSYWEQFEATPEFVVMFLPGESFFSAALERDPALIEEGVQQGVLLATPTTLIALLRAVSYGWRQERLAESAQVVSQLGRELYDRLRTLAEHMDRLGGNLQRAVGSYNQAVGSLEGRVLVSARRFGELGVSVKSEIPELSAIELTPRPLQAPEWTPDEGEPAGPREAETALEDGEDGPSDDDAAPFSWKAERRG